MVRTVVCYFVVCLRKPKCANKSRCDTVPVCDAQSATPKRQQTEEVRQDVERLMMKCTGRRKGRLGKGNFGGGERWWRGGEAPGTGTVDLVPFSLQFMCKFTGVDTFVLSRRPRVVSRGGRYFKQLIQLL